jgi:hypothetical protein
MGEIVISMSKMSESLSIRDSYLEVMSCSFTDKMTGLDSMVKNTCLNGEECMNQLQF